MVLLLSFLFFNVQTGDFFKDDLPKADLYILARVLHDWSDEKVNILLSKVAEACTPGKSLVSPSFKLNFRYWSVQGDK